MLQGVSVADVAADVAVAVGTLVNADVAVTDVAVGTLTAVADVAVGVPSSGVSVWSLSAL